MAHEIPLIPSKTYKTRANAVKAAEKFQADVRFMVVCTEEGRYYPVFIGHDAIQLGTHFHHVTVA